MNSVKISLYVGADEDRFEALMDFLLDNDSEIARKAAWALSFCFKSNPFLFNKYVKVFLEIMGRKDVHVAVKRSATQVLQDMYIPEDLEGLAYDQGMEILHDPESAIAVKAYSLQILQNIAEKFPELKQELVQVVKDRMPFETAAFQSRGKKLIKKFADA